MKGEWGETSVAKVLRRTFTTLARGRITSGTILTAVCVCTASALAVTGSIRYIRSLDTVNTFETTASPVEEPFLSETKDITEETAETGSLAAAHLLDGMRERTEQTKSLLNALREKATGHEEVLAELSLPDPVWEELDAEFVTAYETLRQTEEAASQGNRKEATQALEKFFEAYASVIDLTKQADERAARAGRVIVDNAVAFGLGKEEAEQMTASFAQLLYEHPAVSAERTLAVTDGIFSQGEEKLSAWYDSKEDAPDAAVTAALAEKVHALSSVMEEVVKERATIRGTLQSKMTPQTVNVRAAPKKVTVVRKIDPATLTREDILEFQKTKRDNYYFDMSFMYEVAQYVTSGFKQYGPSIYHQLKYYRAKMARRFHITPEEYDYIFFTLHAKDDYWRSIVPLPWMAPFEDWMDESERIDPGEPPHPDVMIPEGMTVEEYLAQILSEEEMTGEDMVPEQTEEVTQPPEEALQEAVPDPGEAVESRSDDLTEEDEEAQEEKPEEAQEETTPEEDSSEETASEETASEEGTTEDVPESGDEETNTENRKNEGEES